MKWGNNTQSVQQWFFDENYELIGLYGTTTELGISNIGVIVFKALDCSNSNSHDDQVLDE